MFVLYEDNFFKLNNVQIALSQIVCFLGLQVGGRPLKKYEYETNISPYLDTFFSLKFIKTTSKSIFTRFWEKKIF